MLFFLLPLVAHADYILPPLPAVLDAVTSIADVTVTQIDDDGHAHIVLNGLLRGTAPPAELTGVSLSCTGGPPSLFGVKDDTRYIVLLDGSSLYEETSFFEVRGDQCFAWESGHHARSWQPCAGVIAELVPD